MPTISASWCEAVWNSFRRSRRIDVWHGRLAHVLFLETEKHGRAAHATKMPHSSAHEPTHFSPAAMSYARSLLDLANERQHAEPIGQELQQIKEILEQNPGFQEILANPSIGVEEREQLIERIFRNNVSPLIFNTLGVMNKHGRLGIVA